MSSSHRTYAPPPRRRSSSVVRKELYRHLKGKPTHSSAFLTLPGIAGKAVKRVFLLLVVVVLVAGFLLGGLGGGMLAGYISTATPVSTEHIKGTNETTKILDDQGQVVAILTGSENINREYISYSAVKDTHIDDAFKAIEDERFDTHIGIDPRRIFGAILSAMANGGNATHGGSTISQQTVKLVSGEDQISAQRKVQEWYKAIQLEQKKSKDEIMELYLNLVPMGNGYVGIQSAAKAYFDKEAKDLSLIECAYLAGIPNAPSLYNPLTETGRRNGLRRMRIILGKMLELGFINERDYQQALDSELIFRKTPVTVASNQIHSYFIDYTIQQVIADLVEKRGYSEQMASIAVYNYGLTIESTQNTFVQEEAEEAFADQNLFLSDPELLITMPEKPNGSVVIIDNFDNPGQVKGMVGGFGPKTGNFVLNRAVDAHRQPGSSIKPLVVYGPGLDTGKITAASVFTDQEYFLDPDNPTTPYPENATKNYKGNMTVRDALRTSTNTIAAYIWKHVLTGENTLLYLKQVGLDRSAENYVSISLGGFNRGMSTLEMAGAYATFGNQGLYTQPYVYTRVLDSDGNVLLENKPQYDQVYRPETAFVLTDILKSVLIGGTAAGYGLTDMPAAGKTGTTDDNRDKWFCGYTRYYTASVWYGYDNRLGLTTIPREDRNNAIRIWQDVMNRIHTNKEALDFETPDGVIRMTICPESGQKASPHCPQTSSDFFIANAVMNPRDTCSLHIAEPEPEPEDVEPEQPEPDEPESEAEPDA